MNNAFTRIYVRKLLHKIISNRFNIQVSIYILNINTYSIKFNTSRNITKVGNEPCIERTKKFYFNKYLAYSHYLTK